MAVHRLQISIKRYVMSIEILLEANAEVRVEVRECLHLDLEGVQRLSSVHRRCSSKRPGYQVDEN